MHEKDRDLVQRMLEGDPRAYETFFDAYAARLCTFAARRSQLGAATIEDIVQTTLIKAMRSLKGFRGDASLFTWLCEICNRELITMYRKNERTPKLESLERSDAALAFLELHAPEDHDPLIALQLHEHRSAVARTLNSLPERYARALEWKYGDGFSVAEIATMLALTPVAAQSLLARAREAFARAWIAK